MADQAIEPILATTAEIEGFLGDKESYLSEFDFRRILDSLLPPEIIEFINQNYEFVFKKEITDKEGAFLPPGCKGSETSSKAKVEIYKKSFFDQDNKFNLTKFYFAVGHLISHGIKEPQDIPLAQVMPFLTKHAKEAPPQNKQKEIWADFISLSFLNPPLARSLNREVHQEYLWMLDRLPKKIEAVTPEQEALIDADLNPQFVSNLKTSIKTPALDDLFNPALREPSNSIIARLKTQGIL